MAGVLSRLKCVIYKILIRTATTREKSLQSHSYTAFKPVSADSANLRNTLHANPSYEFLDNMCFLRGKQRPRSTGM